MSESLRDRVARALTEHTIYAPMMSDFECSCGFEADDNNAVEVTPNEHIADALIAAGLVAEPQLSRNAHERLAQQRGMSLVIQGAVGTARLRQWTTYPSGRIDIEYRPEVTS